VPPKLEASKSVAGDTLSASKSNSENDPDVVSVVVFFAMMFIFTAEFKFAATVPGYSGAVASCNKCVGTGGGGSGGGASKFSGTTPAAGMGAGGKKESTSIFCLSSHTSFFALMLFGPLLVESKDSDSKP